MIRLFQSFFLMIVCTTTGCISENDPEGPSLGVGDSLPEFSVTLNTGETVSSSDLKGKHSAIVFFNTGCGDCRQELPVVNQLWDHYKDDPEVVILPIAREETEEEISEYWAESGFTMPYSPQKDRSVYNLFASSVIPRIYIAGPDRKITAAFDDSDMPDLEKLIAELEN